MSKIQTIEFTFPNVNNPNYIVYDKCQNIPFSRWPGVKYFALGRQTAPKFRQLLYTGYVNIKKTFHIWRNIDVILDIWQMFHGHNIIFLFSDSERMRQLSTKIHQWENDTNTTGMESRNRRNSVVGKFGWVAMTYLHSITI